MNYIGKIKYSILETPLAEFSLMVDALLKQLPLDIPVLRLVFFGMPPSNQVYVERYIILKEKVKACFGQYEPVLSYVCQPSLDNGLILEVHSYLTEPSDILLYKTYESLPYVLLQNEWGRFLFAGGFQSDVLNYSIEEQSKKVFQDIENLLRLEQFPINSIIRQWNYIEEIVGFQGVYQNYQALNDARSDFYAKTTWENGYPAATGIGVSHGGILIDFDAVVFTSPTCFATPLDNKLQVAAHEYSEQVLISEQEKKTTPKFERAKSMGFDGRGIVYISGTAAIRGEDSLHDAGLATQLRITMENIAWLISKENLTSAGAVCCTEPHLSMLRVYLKEKSFVDEAKKLIESYELSIPVSYLWADVCRDELLIEIEGIALY